MKRSTSSPRQLNGSFAAWVFALLPVVLGGSAALAASTAPAPDTGPKPYSLFMGTDLSVERNKAFHRVKEVSGSSFVITLNGRPEFIPGNRSGLNLKIEQALKLTPVSATLANVSGVRAYTPNNDPERKWLRKQSEMSMILAEQAAASQQQSMKSRMLPQGGDGPNRFNPYDTPDAQRNLSQDQQALQGSLNDAGDSIGLAKDELAEENFDAIEIKFDVSSPRPLNNPYVVVIARYRSKNTPAGTARNWIYAKSLDPIDTQPQKIRLLEGGFPLGFILEDYKVHLYNQGKEVATNVSSKRVELTRDEAYQYLLIDYIGSHKGATLPAAPALANFTADAVNQLSGGQAQKQLFVRVSVDGLPGGVFADQSCSEVVQDPKIESLVKDIRFKPALEKGKPVEGVARVRLQDLTPEL